MGLNASSPLTDEESNNASGLKCTTNRSNMNTVRSLKIIYILSIIIWLVIILLFRLYNTDIVGLIILMIPFVTFTIGYYMSHLVTKEVERSLFQTNFITVGLIVILPLLTWINKDFTGDRGQFVSVLVLAIILMLLSILDVWVPEGCWLSVARHIRSVLQTMSLILVIWCFYSFYLKNPHIIMT